MITGAIKPHLTDLALSETKDYYSKYFSLLINYNPSKYQKDKELIIQNIKNNKSNKKETKGLCDIIKDGLFHKVTDSTMENNTYLHWWIANDNTEITLQILQALKDKGLLQYAALNAQDSNKKTPFLFAIAKKYMEKGTKNFNQYNAHDAKLIKFLIDNADKTNLTTGDKNGNTPLHIAIVKRDFDTVRLLMQKMNTMNVNLCEIKNNDGKTLLNMLEIEYHQAKKIIDEIYKYPSLMANQND